MSHGRNGRPSSYDELTSALGLGDARAVTDVAVFGRGPGARVHIALADGAVVRFERFADIANPSQLSQHLVTFTGTYKAFKGPEAGNVAAVVHRLAEHHAELDERGAAVEWGAEYLRAARPQPVAMDDQASRWRAFALLANTEPGRDAGEDRSPYALASASVYLLDAAVGARYVRAGWFGAYVRREVGGVYSPEKLATLMATLGWERRGRIGRIKATNPTDGRSLAFSFYVVAGDWPDAGVTPGVDSYAREAAKQPLARAIKNTSGNPGTESP